MKKLRYLKALWSVPADIIGHLRNESHRSRLETYVALRRAYSLSRGRSRTIVPYVFKLARPIPKDQTCLDPDIIEALTRDGISIVPGFLAQEKAKQIRYYLSEQDGVITGENNRRETAKLHSVKNGVSLRYSSEVTLRNPLVRELLENKFILGIAATYLGCVPIFTGAPSWWSLSDPEATRGDLDWSAQLYHYDYDYPSFLKFFIYLTDVGESDGPFTYVRGTHKKKKDWGDGRRSDAYLAENYGNKISPITGKAGDLIIADTSGYHKGQQVLIGPRLILQFEFASSLLGGSSLYPLLPKSLKPASRGHTFDLFSG